MGHPLHCQVRQAAAPGPLTDGTLMQPSCVSMWFVCGSTVADKIRVSVRTFNGRVLVDLRDYYKAGACTAMLGATLP
jgi:hypothetical protein